MATHKPKRPVGAPTKFRPEFLEMATKFCLLGVTNDQLAEALGVSVATIVVWMQERPRFRAAVKAGRLHADAAVSNMLYHKAIGFKQQETHIAAVPGIGVVKTVFNHKYPPSEVAQFFWLKNRRPDLWRPDSNLQPQGPQPEDSARLLREQLASMDNLTEGKEQK